MAIPPLLKRYSVPLSFFSLGLLFQLFVLPRSFPPNHYDVLGVNRHASIEEVAGKYEEIWSRFVSLDSPVSTDIIKVRYAFEILSNPLWKRDYDIFGIDEQLHVIDKIKEQYGGELISKLVLPFLYSPLSDSFSDEASLITSEELISSFENSSGMLILVYSAGSPRCAQFINEWKKIAGLMEGVAETGTVELGNLKLASYLAEKKFTNQPYFRKGLPAVVAFPPGCKNAQCIERYDGVLSADTVVDWMATNILGLPRISYYSKESLIPQFIAKSGRHKAKVIFFSKTGERAAPFLRQAVIDYWNYASFAFVLWREADLSIWWNMFGVESAPAIAIFKDYGLKPFVYHGAFDSSKFQKIMDEYKDNELPQLRSITSMELGCDARGHSRAGTNNSIWYCVIVAGRQGPKLIKMRETIRRVRDILLTVGDSDHTANADTPIPALAAATFKENRLTFAWIDGEAQQKYCLFHLTTEEYRKCCAPIMYEDADGEPQIFMVRYSRNLTKDDQKVDEKISTWDSLKRRAQNNMLQQEDDLASQLTAKYNSSQDTEEIMRWISNMIEYAESIQLPYFTSTAPELVPEDSTSFWSSNSPKKSSVSWGLKQRLKKLLTYLVDLLDDPRIGPSVMLCACISFGTVWLQSNNKASQSRPVKVDDATTSNNGRGKRPSRSRRESRDAPPSITDVEPKDAQNLLSSGSDSE